MYIEDLEITVIEKLKTANLFKLVKRYAGELDTHEILKRSSGQIPSALILTAGVADCAGLDQVDSEQVDISIIILVSSMKNNIHGLRRSVKRVLKGFDADGKLTFPLESIKTDTLVVTPSVSVYSMHFKCMV